MAINRYTIKYALAHHPNERHPSRIVSPVAMYQRPNASVSTYLRTAPSTTAQMRTVPKLVPADNDETISPAPTPVAATTSPGPTYLSFPPNVVGARSSAGLSATSAMASPFESPSRSHIRHER